MLIFSSIFEYTYFLFSNSNVFQRVLDRRSAYVQRHPRLVRMVRWNTGHGKHYCQQLEWWRGYTFKSVRQNQSVWSKVHRYRSRFVEILPSLCLPKISLVYLKWSRRLMISFSVYMFVCQFLCLSVCVYLYVCLFFFIFLFLFLFPFDYLSLSDYHSLS